MADADKKWVLKIDYSWGENEAPIRFDSWEAAAREAKRLAMEELMIAGSEHGWMVEMHVPEDIGFEKDKRSSVELHYQYDDTWCYYVIEEYDYVIKEYDGEDVFRAPDKKDEMITVEVPAGTLRAYADKNPDQPGISVTLIPNGVEENEIDVAYISSIINPELLQSPIPKAIGQTKGDVQICTYEDPYKEDYTYIGLLRQKNVEDAFRED